MVATAALMFVNGVDDREPALPDAVRITDVPDSYRIVYEVRAAAGPDGGETVTTEVLQVERPFRSLVATRPGAPPGDRLVSGRVSDLNALFLFDDGEWAELQIPPAMAASDVRLDGVLDDLVADGQADRRDDVRRVAGRPCQVHRLGGPIGGGSLLPVGSVEGEHADLCIDRAGLVLSEEWVVDGAAIRTRTAVDVEVDVEFDDDTFTVADAEPVPATAGGGAARRVTDDSRFGARTWELPHVPDGFEHLGRWSVVRPRLDVSVDPLSAPTTGRVAGIATVWVDGVDALVLEQGGAADRGRPFEAHPRGEPVELGDLLDLGEVITDARGTEVRVSYVDGTFVRLWSTLPRQQVIDLARRLEAGPGGEPQIVDES